MDKSSTTTQTCSVRVSRVSDAETVWSEDRITVEAPLQIIIRYGPRGKRQLCALATTMRTPGQDDLLATGYLYTENIIHRREDIIQIRHLKNDEILVELRDSLVVAVDGQHRHSYINSSCGICGKSRIEDLKSTMPFLLKKNTPVFNRATLFQWPRLLSEFQEVFRHTGGLHAAALVAAHGLLAIQEDIGRHNAVDKLIGYALLNYTLPLENMAMIVSARASFEMVQKSLMAGLPVLAAIGATSSLAVELASENNMTLIGFLKDSRFNIYCHPERID